MDWYRAVSCYVSVVECGSFARAAEELMLTKSACSKRVSLLEQQLKVQLLIRTTRRLHVTEAGEQFFQQSKLWLSQFDQIRNELTLAPGQLSGRLTIGSPVVMLQLYLTPIVVKFLRKYPNITVELVETEPGSLPDITHDIILSRTIPNYNAVGYRRLKLFEYAVKLYASPAFVAQNPPIRQVEDLKELPLLLVRSQTRAGGIKLNDGSILKEGCNLQSDDPMVMIKAALDGFGIVALSSDIVHQYLQSGQLIEVLPELESERRAQWAYYPALTFKNPNTEAFLVFLREARFEDILPWLRQ